MNTRFHRDPGVVGFEVTRTLPRVTHVPLFPCGAARVHTITTTVAEQHCITPLPLTPSYLAPFKLHSIHHSKSTCQNQQLDFTMNALASSSSTVEQSPLRPQRSGSRFLQSIRKSISHSLTPLRKRNAYGDLVSKRVHSLYMILIRRAAWECRHVFNPRRALVLRPPTNASAVSRIFNFSPYH